MKKFYYVSKSTEEDYESIYTGYSKMIAENIASKESYKSDVYIEVYPVINDNYLGEIPGEERIEFKKFYNGVGEVI